MNTNNGKTYYQNVLYVEVKKPRFIKEQEVSGLLSGLGIKTPSSNIRLLEYSTNDLRIVMAVLPR